MWVLTTNDLSLGRWPLHRSLVATRNRPRWGRYGHRKIVSSSLSHRVCPEIRSSPIIESTDPGKIWDGLRLANSTALVSVSIGQWRPTSRTRLSEEKSGEERGTESTDPCIDGPHTTRGPVRFVGLPLVRTDIRDGTTGGAFSDDQRIGLRMVDDDIGDPSRAPTPLTDDRSAIYHVLFVPII